MLAAALVVAGVSVGRPIVGAGQSGTAAISGIVIDDQEPARPLGRAIVTVSAPELPTSRSVVTDQKGIFLIGSLPAGRYTVKAEKPAYLTAALGSKRPSRSGTPLVLASGANLSGLVVRLWRGAVVTGRITDESGRPVRGAAVRAVRDGGAGDPSLPVFSNNIIGPTPPGSAGGGAMTNDRGEYRIFGLEPGEYVVMATPPYEIGDAVSSMTDAAVDALLAQLRQGRRVAASPATGPAGSGSSLYAPMFYPGTANLDAATVDAGDGSGNERRRHSCRADSCGDSQWCRAGGRRDARSRCDCLVVPDREGGAFHQSSLVEYQRSGRAGRFIHDHWRTAVCVQIDGEIPPARCANQHAQRGVDAAGLGGD